MLMPTEIYPAGTLVEKKSGKPFKSGLKQNTVKSLVEHPYKTNPETGQGVPSYTFYEDSSIVEAAMVKKIENIFS